MMAETRKGTNEIFSYSQMKRRSFHEKYLIICKTKLLQPLKEVKLKQGNFQLLEFHADRIKVNDWLAICGALEDDRTLKFISIKLRKNEEEVLEHVDTLKKSKRVVSVPAIYSKFLLNELVESLQTMLSVNKALEVLALEGLPIRARYMQTLAKGLYSNRSIKVLNLSRSNIGDEGCEILCSNIKNLSNIETLNLSHCNFGFKGAQSVKSLIKFQKIHRFSEAWIRSLRYQDIEPSLFGGLKIILLNNNPKIGDEGLKLLTDELCEDVWISNIEMQNCGLSHFGAIDILNCLNINKTIINFNVSNNIKIPDHIIRQIIMRLSGSDVESGDSGDLEVVNKKITKAELLDKIKYLEEQLDSEIFKRKNAEDLNCQLKEIIDENQRQIAEISNQEFSVPDGFTLIPKCELQKLVIREKGSFIRHSASNIAVKLRRRRRNPVRRTRSLLIENPINKVITSKSEGYIRAKRNAKKQFIEHNIGDTRANNSCEAAEKDEDIDFMQYFIKTKTTSTTDYEFVSLCKKSYLASCVPKNSEIETDED